MQIHSKRFSTREVEFDEDEEKNFIKASLSFLILNYLDVSLVKCHFSEVYSFRKLFNSLTVIILILFSEHI